MQKTSLILAAALFFSTRSFAQSLPQFASTYTDSYLRMPYKLFPDDNRQPVTLIDGAYVRGLPFLDMMWRSGYVKLKNGNVYSSYKLKFDTYRQVVVFLDDKDSLDVADPINEFSITDKDGLSHRFINADEYKPQKNPLFYEILLNDKKGTLLKVHQTKVKASAELSNIASERSLYQSYEYLWYDRPTDKIHKLPLSAAGIKDALKLSEVDANKMAFDSYRFNNEDDLFNFFNVYIQN